MRKITPEKQQVLTKAIVNLSRILGISRPKLARILGVSTASVKNMAAGSYLLSENEWDAAVLLVRLFKALDTLVGGSDEISRKWLWGKNLGLEGGKPYQLIDSQEGLNMVVKYLESFLFV